MMTGLYKRGLTSFAPLIAWIAISLIPSAALAQTPTPPSFSSSPNPVGSGARAVGRGGAFIAIADDATAGSWNPAGLVQLEYPETSAAGSYFSRGETVTDSGSGPYDYDGAVMSAFELNYFSVAYPTEALPLYTVFSVNYQRLYEFDRNIDYSLDNSASGPLLFNSTGSGEYEQSGALTAISLAIAIEINYRFSLGATVNVWDNNLSPNGWELKHRHRETGDFTLGINTYDFDFIYRGDEKFRIEQTALNYNFGFLWDINGVWRIGGVYKTGLEAGLVHEIDSYSALTVPGQPLFDYADPFKDSFEATLYLPPAYGVGVNYRPSDPWSFALDVYVTQWNFYRIDGQEGLSQLELEPTAQVRVGAEYLHIIGQTVYPFRAGLFYDPEPNVGNPVDVWGASLGAGYARGPFLLDAALQYRFGRGMEGEIVVDQQAEREIDEITALVSVIYHFE